MIPQKRNIFCVIVHFGLHEPTNTLIAQLLGNSQVPGNIIVIDNGGGDPFLHPDAQVVSDGRNHGYAGGINIGIDMLWGVNTQPQDIVICMNNDVEVAPNTLQQVEGSVTGGMLAGHHVWGINVCTGRTIPRDYAQRHPWYVLPYVHGSFLAAAYEHWKKITPIPESYFMYWEDVLLSVRASRTGMSLVSLPDAGIMHNDTSANSSPEQMYYLVRNGDAFLRTQTPGLWKIYWTCMHWARLLYHALIPGHRLILKALWESSRVWEK